MKLLKRELQELEKQNLFFIYARDKKGKMLFVHANTIENQFYFEYTFINAVLATKEEAENIINSIIGENEQGEQILFKTISFYNIVNK